MMAQFGLTIKKLKSNKRHKSKSQAELEELARELTDKEKLLEQFEHLLKPGQALARDFIEEEVDQLHSLEFEIQHQRVKNETSKACHLPVKLSLHKLKVYTPPGAFSFANLLKFEYGALHTAVVIGDVVIEWDRASLVRPRIAPVYQTEFQANVEEQGEWYDKLTDIRKQMSMANRQRSTERKLRILFESLEEKKKLIEKVVDVIIDFNRNREYNVFKCNCQDFAREALAALGIKKPIEFTGKLQERFEQLKKGNRDVPPELNTHQNLDAYIQENIRDLEKHDMEFLQCLYFKFHLPAIEDADRPELWQCEVPTCMSSELDIAIRRSSVPTSMAGVSHGRKEEMERLLVIREELHGMRANSKPKCLECTSFFGDEELGGLCNGCFAFKTETDVVVPKEEYITAAGGGYSPPVASPQKASQPGTPKCIECTSFCGSEEYGGLCHGCFLFKTQTEATQAREQGKTDRQGPLHSPTVQSKQTQCHQCGVLIDNTNDVGLCGRCFVGKAKRATSMYRSEDEIIVQDIKPATQRSAARKLIPAYENCIPSGNTCCLCVGAEIMDINHVCSKHKAELLRLK